MSTNPYTPPVTIESQESVPAGYFRLHFALTARAGVTALLLAVPLLFVRLALVPEDNFDALEFVFTFALLYTAFALVYAFLSLFVLRWIHHKSSMLFSWICFVIPAGVFAYILQSGLNYLVVGFSPNASNMPKIVFNLFIATFIGVCSSWMVWSRLQAIKRNRDYPVQK